MKFFPKSSHKRNCINKKIIEKISISNPNAIKKIDKSLELKFKEKFIGQIKIKKDFFRFLSIKNEFINNYFLKILE